MTNPKRLIVAMTGASGAVYAERVLSLLSKTDIEVHLTISEAATITLRKERGITVDLEAFRIADVIGTDAPNIVYHHYRNVGASIASGSFRTMGMIVVPCSMGTAGAIAHGLSMNLIHRAADVCLKERRRLVVVPRETPFNTMHLENLLRLSQAGAVVLPAMPGYYHNPKTIDDQIDFVVTKLLDQFDLDFDLITRWQG